MLLKDKPTALHPNATLTGAEEVAASTEEQAAAMAEVYPLAETLTGLSHALEAMVQKFTI